MLGSAIKQRFTRPQWVATDERLAQLAINELADTWTIRVGSQQQGAVLELHIGYRQGRIENAYFLAYGSPTLIAGADFFCESLQQLSAGELANLDLSSVQSVLSIPNTQYHVILLLNECLEKIKEYFAQRAADEVA